MYKYYRTMHKPSKKEALIDKSPTLKLNEKKASATDLRLVEEKDYFLAPLSQDKKLPLLV